MFTNVLITGASGFIGLHLCKHILQNTKSKIVCLDRYLDPNGCRLFDSTDRVDFVNQDLSTDLSEEAMKSLEAAECIFHLAAFKTNKAGEKRFYQDNVLATERIINLPLKNLKQFFFTSTLYVYGSNFGTASEDDEPHPDTAYGMSKLVCEKMLFDRFSGTATNLAIPRLFFVFGNPIGTSIGYKSVILKHIDRIKNGLAPVIYGSGEQMLDYIYIDDVTEAFDALIKNEFNGVVNISSGTLVSVNDLTRDICDVMDYKGKLEYQSADWTDGTSRGGDNRRLLAMHAKRVGFQQALKSMVNE